MHPDFPEGSSPPFTVHAPAQQRVPFVFNSPHSGREYPLAFRAASRLTAQQLRRSEDVAVDVMFHDVVRMGAPMLAANFPRAWLDVNREPLELDPKLIADPLPPHANSRSARVGGGLGTVPRLVAERTEIYAGRMTLGEAMARINGVYRPYHEQLARLIARTVNTFGHAVLVDCHSMPSKGPGADGDATMRDDIILGDRYGTSCNAAITQVLAERFSEAGYRVARNKPYAGGFITEHYGRPSRGFHAVQIEINRGLYLDETSLEPNAHFATLKADIARVMEHLMSIPDSGFAPHAQGRHGRRMIDTGLLGKTFHDACAAAARETLPRFRTGVRVSNKLEAGFDPVTEADREAEVAIREVIAGAFPDHAIFGEEHGASGPADSPWRWIIDPVDGTRAFISGLPVWGTLIALYHEGKPVAGALDQPFTGERFLALPDGSSVSADRFGERNLSTSDVTSLADATIMTVDPHMLDNDDDRAFFSCAERAKLVRYGCDCYAYAMVAAGHVDAVIESHMQIYDIAALIPLIVNAGGVVSNWQGGDASEGGQVLACANATLHAQMVDLLKD